MTIRILAREIEPQVDRLVDELTARGVPVFRADLWTAATRSPSTGREFGMIAVDRE